MYSYSSSSMSLYGRRKSNSNNNYYNNNASYSPRSNDENRSSVANTAMECRSPISTPTKSAPPAPSSPPRSPFVTPNHPLYVFGDDQFNNSSSCCSSEDFEPPAPQKQKNCLDSLSLQQMSLESPREEDKPSPFRKLKLSNAFDQADDAESSSSSEQRQIYETPHSTSQEQKLLLPHRILRKSTTFGLERMRKMSVDSPLQRKLVVIEGDLEGEDGLATRLRRMKRRLFLENVASSPQYCSEQEQPLDETPKHSNTTAMEGMEVVLEEEGNAAAVDESNNNDNAGFYLTFSASFESLQMEIDEEPAAPSTSKMPKSFFPGDSSVTTEATAACSTFGDDSYWASLSSISEHE